MHSELRPWRAIVRDLRVLVPPVWPVEVRRVKMPKDAWGDCSLRKGKGGPRYVIRVDRDLEPIAALQILIHEWAHVLSWGSESHLLDDHGPEFGLAYSRVYQALFER
jgi:hypothetical protein